MYRTHSRLADLTSKMQLPVAEQLVRTNSRMTESTSPCQNRESA